MNEECIYQISQSNSTYIDLTIINLETDSTTDSTGHLKDFLEVRDGESDKSPLISKFFGANVTASVQSTDNFMSLR